MKHSSSSSSRRQIRAPFGPVTDLMHVTIGLYEIQDLVKQLTAELEQSQVPSETVAKLANISSLAGGIINVTLADSQAWQRIAEMQKEVA